MSGPLDGRGVLITGGGTGIGRALAMTYAEAGARVVVAGRRRAPLEETATLVRRGGGTCHAVPVDVRDEGDCVRLIGTALVRLDRLDVLVNNAGVPGTDMSVGAMTLENWNDTIATNLTGAMLLTREALRQAMIPAGAGNVQFCSSAASMNVRPQKAHYAVAIERWITRMAGESGRPADTIRETLVASDDASAITGQSIAVTGGALMR